MEETRHGSNNRSTPSDLDQAMRDVEELMYGGNYDFGFRLEYLIDFDGPRDPWNGLLQLVYTDVKQEVNGGLSFRGDEHAGLSLTGEQEQVLSARIEAFWSKFEEYFPASSVTFYRDPQPSWGVHWGFSYVIADHRTGQAFAFSAGADD